MKFIHTSDWHLGRIFFNVRLIHDQAHVLDQFVDLVREELPDVVVIAGDVYDRAQPPIEAVQLLDETLSRIILGLGIPVIVIAGNHDSPERLSFGSALMQAQGLHIVGLPDQAAPIDIDDAYGTVRFAPIPYGEPVVVREVLGASECDDHNKALEAQITSLMEDFPTISPTTFGKAMAEIAAGNVDPPAGQKPGVQPTLFGPNRMVAIAHAFVGGGTVSDSERSLSVGGSGMVDATHFAPFTYTALGHLHRPQTLTGTSIRYSGSLLKYSFDEASHGKSVTIVEIDGEGNTTLRTAALSAKRDVRRIEGPFREILGGPRPRAGREDYVSISLTDKTPVWDAMNRLRAVYPNVLEIIFSQSALEDATGASLAGVKTDHRKTTELELFRDFYGQVMGEELTPEEEAVFTRVLQKTDGEMEVG